MLEWTGERFIPWMEGAQIHYEHIHRYAFASQFVKGKKVLDMACGEGYGSHALSKNAEYVVGVEIDENAVEHARNKYTTQNLEFIQGSILEIPIQGNEKFDVIVCFEGIEHVEEHEKLLSEVKRLLNKEGLFIVSSPNKKTYRDDLDFNNPFHKKEMYFNDFRELLDKYYSNCIFFGQKVYVSSNIWSLPPYQYSGYKEFIIEKHDEEFYFSDIERKTPLYFIAIASDKKLDHKSYNIGSHLVDVSNILIGDFEKQVGMLTSTVGDRDKNITKINSALQAKDTQITELTSALQAKDTQITELTSALQAKDAQIAELTSAMQTKDAQIAEIQQSIVWRLLMKYHSGFVERLLLPGTKRRRIYDLGLKGGRILVNEGLRSFWWHYKLYRHLKKSGRQLNKHRKKKLNLKNWNGERLIFPKYSENPDVSIIIPVHNNIKFTFNCLKSILKNTQGLFEIIVVDDASYDETPNLLNNVENIKIIKNDENRGFVDSCNIGAKVSKAKYLLFLNNDTIVTENWLEPLKNAIEKDNVGAVGAKLVYPDGKLQEAGGIIWNDASGWNYGRYDDPDKPEYNFVREVDYCSGAALLVRRDLFEKFGGFDERFKPGYYEDTDLCFSIRSSGYKVLYQPESVVIHFEGITGGTDITSGVKKYQEINKEKFFKKWFDILEKEQYEPDSTNLFLARDRRKGKNILVIDHYVPTFDRDSGSYRMHNLLKILTELGHKVTFIGDNLARFESYTSILQRHGVEVVYAPYIKSIEEYLTKNGRFFDIVILSRAHIATNHISSVKKYCDKAKLVFDTVDLQFLRESRRAKIENNEIVLKEADKLKKLEFQLARMSDITFVVSPVEKEIMLKEDPSLRIEVISNIHEIKQLEKGFSERRDIMFLGGFAHIANVDAVKWFVKEIYPLIKEKIPDVKFYVVGNEPPKDVKSLSSDDIIVTGYVKDLTPYFENCRVFVSPLRYGAGVKGKINHSMSHGLPVVTTFIGAEGIGLVEGVDTLIADAPREFAEKVIELYENEELWNTLSRSSIENVRKNYSHEVIKERLENVFEKDTELE